MAAAELERMEHPPYSPDLAPCDFFLFGSVKGKWMGKQYEMPDDFVSEVRNRGGSKSPRTRPRLARSWTYLRSGGLLRREMASPFLSYILFAINIFAAKNKRLSEQL
jgi:hypothetical protein